MKLLPVPAFQETLHAGYCGPATLKMVLEYWGISKTEQELAQQTGAEKDNGTTIDKLAEVARLVGLHADIQSEASYADIEAYLERDIPVIVNWFTRGRKDYPDSAVPDGHYSVVIGLDDTSIHLQDPEIGSTRNMTRTDFLKVWFDFQDMPSREGLMLRHALAIYR